MKSTNATEDAFLVTNCKSLSTVWVSILKLAKHSGIMGKRRIASDLIALRTAVSTSSKELLFTEFRTGLILLMLIWLTAGVNWVSRLNRPKEISVRVFLTELNISAMKSPIRSLTSSINSYKYLRLHFGGPSGGLGPKR